MTVALNTEIGRDGFICIDVEGEATAAHCLGSILNPEGVDVVILEAFMYIVTAAGAASTLHVGVGATLDADYHDLSDGLDLSGTAGTAWSGMHPVAADAAMTTPAVWQDDYYVTFTTAAQVSTGFVGRYFIRYVRCA